MSGKTNELVDWVQNMPKVAGAASPFYDAREYDAVVASGEQVTAGLLAIALQSMDINARSWQGWQIPIKTDNAHGAARIQEIDGADIDPRLAGATLAELPERFRQRGWYGVVASKVEPGSRAARSGLRPGDYILGVNQRRVDDLQAFRDRMQDPPRTLQLDVRRGGRTGFLRME